MGRIVCTPSGFSLCLPSPICDGRHHHLPSHRATSSNPLSTMDSSHLDPIHLLSCAPSSPFRRHVAQDRTAHWSTAAQHPGGPPFPYNEIGTYQLTTYDKECIRLRPQYPRLHNALQDFAPLSMSRGPSHDCQIKRWCS